VAAVALVLAAGWRAQKEIRGSAWLGEAERALHRDPGPAGAERALLALDRAAAVTPGVFRVHLRTAQMLLRLHRAPEAVRAIRRALALEPFSANAWTTLAAADLDGGKAWEARADAGSALVLLADHPFALFIDARAAEATGDGDGAGKRWRELEALAAHAVEKDTAEAARTFLRSHGGDTH
jgi:predicted Zn-dependent protease